MSSQPGGGPAIPAAAALAGLGADENQTDQTDDGVPVGSADAEQDRIRAGEASEDDEDRAEDDR